MIRIKKKKFDKKCKYNLTRPARPVQCAGPAKTEPSKYIIVKMRYLIVNRWMLRVVKWKSWTLPFDDLQSVISTYDRHSRTRTKSTGEGSIFHRVERSIIMVCLPMILINNVSVAKLQKPNFKQCHSDRSSDLYINFI